MKKDDLKDSATPNTMVSVLQQLNKEAEKKEAAAESMRVRCKICFKETAPRRICGGHGGGSGSSDSATEAKSDALDADVLIQTSDKIINNTKLDSEFDVMIDDMDTQLQSIQQRFNPKIIAELIASGLLTIDNDRQLKTLTIQLQCEPHSLSKEQRDELKKFMCAVLDEWEAFQKENHMSDDCLKIDQDNEGNILSLRIHLPTLTLYDVFIQRLANHLLPIPNPKLEKREEISLEQKNNKEDDFEPDQIFNPSPFSTKPWSK